MKSKRITLEQLSEAYGYVVGAKDNLLDATLKYETRQAEFDTLTNRTSKEVLAQFMREGNLFN